METVNELIKEFKKIRAKGFIKSLRKHNTGIGKTFEDLLKIEENNLTEPDFENIEIKTQRFLTGSKVTLFTKSPTFPDLANHYIRENFGNIDDKTGTKVIHTSFYGNKYNNYLNRYSFKLKVDKRTKKIFILVKDIQDILLEDNIYYGFDDLKESTKKLDNLLVVTANTKMNKNMEYFHFTKATIYSGFKFKKFLDFIKSGKIQYDIRIGTYKSGKNFGKPHDHGSGFRIVRDEIGNLYNNYYEL